MTRQRVLFIAIAVVAAGALIAAIVLTRAGGDDSGPQALSDEAPKADLASFYSQELSWTDCSGARCTFVEVPLDYERPDEKTIKLKLRLQAESEDSDRPVLFINPGGPGGSGVGYVSQFDQTAGKAVTDAYDVAGLDPRGVAESTPLECVDDDTFDEIVNIDPDPDNADEIRELIDGTRVLGEGCQSNGGDLAAHVSTVEVARDFDIVRALLGQEKFDYYGASYGTQIGATYAELFPDNVGRMVLDAAIDPTLTDEEAGRGQSVGFNRALESYVSFCVGRGDCPLGTDEDAALDELSDFLDGLEEQPMSTGDRDRPLTKGLAFYGVAVTLYSQQTWPLLTNALNFALNDDEGAAMLGLADAYFQRTKDGYTNNSGEVISAVRCLDSPSDVTVEEVQELVPDYEAESPVFGTIFAWSSLTCGSWPIEQQVEVPEIDAAGAPPIVVVGTTRDPATPYEWAEALAEQLESGVLLTREGDGHIGYRQGNTCVDEAVELFLTSGEPPEGDTTCP